MLQCSQSQHGEANERRGPPAGGDEQRSPKVVFGKSKLCRRCAALTLQIVCGARRFGVRPGLTRVEKRWPAVVIPLKEDGRPLNFTAISQRL
jgi:hypothetical protein